MKSVSQSVIQSISHSAVHLATQSVSQSVSRMSTVDHALSCKEAEYSGLQKQSGADQSCLHGEKAPLNIQEHLTRIRSVSSAWRHRKSTTRNKETKPHGSWQRQYLHPTRSGPNAIFTSSSKFTTTFLWVVEFSRCPTFHSAWGHRVTHCAQYEDEQHQEHDTWPVKQTTEPTNCMEHSHSWEADSYSASQDILRLLWNLIVHYRVHNSQPLVPILSQMNPVKTLPPCFRKIHSRTVYPRLHIPSGLFLSGSSTKIVYEFLTSPMRATRPVNSKVIIWFLIVRGR